MQLIEVNNSALEKAFIDFPHPLYKDYPNYIRPLDKDIAAVFDPKKNKFYQHGEAIRWMLKDEKGKYIGRVAAFYSSTTMNKDNDQPTGGMGFFECINDQEAAFKLFDACKDWLTDKGLEAMDGPINFGERDKWWGLLIEGHDRTANYENNYHPEYYQALFENYGFKIYFKQYTFGRYTFDPLSDLIHRRAEKILNTEGYRFETIDKKNLDKYTRDFTTVYNDAWQNFEGVASISYEQAKSLMEQMKPIMDERLIYFGYYYDEPVAIYINLPEVNQIFRHMNGKWNIWQMIKFKYLQMRGVSKRVMGMVFGVATAHQGKGVESALIIEAGKNVINPDVHNYSELEMNWIGDFNPAMMHLAKNLGTKIVKTHHTYRLMFDPNKEVTRHPRLGFKKKAAAVTENAK
ncbi:hypothetical protein [Persicobacter diffluens]|uniref:N-acetyltransferase domain-containing protein n=1 Tax=Persicobacter diffluens TaxID=981 RepID=A0AAN4VVZ4_9BACT|nr:hypothetical protein PEDI_03720 [Persicobacter diffluens]